jgi:hypothetical protein
MYLAKDFSNDSRTPKNTADNGANCFGNKISGHAIDTEAPLPPVTIQAINEDAIGSTFKNNVSIGCLHVQDDVAISDIPWGFEVEKEHALQNDTSDYEEARLVRKDTRQRNEQQKIEAVNITCDIYQVNRRHNSADSNDFFHKHHAINVAATTIARKPYNGSIDSTDVNRNKMLDDATKSDIPWGFEIEREHVLHNDTSKSVNADSEETKIQCQWEFGLDRKDILQQNEQQRNELTFDIYQANCRRKSTESNVFFQKQQAINVEATTSIAKQRTVSIGSTDANLNKAKYDAVTSESPWGFEIETEQALQNYTLESKKINAEDLPIHKGQGECRLNMKDTLQRNTQQRNEVVNTTFDIYQANRRQNSAESNEVFQKHHAINVAATPRTSKQCHVLIGSTDVNRNKTKYDAAIAEIPWRFEIEREQVLQNDTLASKISNAGKVTIHKGLLGESTQDTLQRIEQQRNEVANTSFDIYRRRNSAESDDFFQKQQAINVAATTSISKQDNVSIGSLDVYRNKPKYDASRISGTPCGFEIERELVLQNDALECKNSNSDGYKIRQDVAEIRLDTNDTIQRNEQQRNIGVNTTFDEIFQGQEAIDVEATTSLSKQHNVPMDSSDVFRNKTNYDAAISDIPWGFEIEREQVLRNDTLESQNSNSEVDKIQQDIGEFRLETKGKLLQNEQQRNDVVNTTYVTYQATRHQNSAESSDLFQKQQAIDVEATTSISRQHNVSIRRTDVFRNKIEYDAAISDILWGFEIERGHVLPNETLESENSYFEDVTIHQVHVEPKLEKKDTPLRHEQQRKELLNPTYAIDKSNSHHISTQSNESPQNQQADRVMPMHKDHQAVTNDREAFLYKSDCGKVQPDSISSKCASHDQTIKNRDEFSLTPSKRSILSAPLPAKKNENQIVIGNEIIGSGDLCQVKNDVATSSQSPRLGIHSNQSVADIGISNDYTGKFRSDEGRAIASESIQHEEQVFKSSDTIYEHPISRMRKLSDRFVTNDKETVDQRQASKMNNQFNSQYSSRHQAQEQVSNLSIDTSPKKKHQPIKDWPTEKHEVTEHSSTARTLTNLQDRNLESPKHLERKNSFDSNSAVNDSENALSHSNSTKYYTNLLQFNQQVNEGGSNYSREHKIQRHKSFECLIDEEKNLLTFSLERQRRYHQHTMTSCSFDTISTVKSADRQVSNNYTNDGISDRNDEYESISFLPINSLFEPQPVRMNPDDFQHKKHYINSRPKLSSRFQEIATKMDLDGDIGDDSMVSPFDHDHVHYHAKYDTERRTHRGRPSFYHMKSLLSDDTYENETEETQTIEGMSLLGIGENSDVQEPVARMEDDTQQQQVHSFLCCSFLVGDALDFTIRAWPGKDKKV